MPIFRRTNIETDTIADWAKLINSDRLNNMTKRVVYVNGEPKMLFQRLKIDRSTPLSIINSKKNEHEKNY
jgi:hypothetical protein